MSKLTKQDKQGSLWGIGNLLGYLDNPQNVPEYTHAQHQKDMTTAAKLESAIEKQKFQRETLIPKIREYIKEVVATFKARFQAQSEAYQQGKEVKSAEADMLIERDRYQRHVQGLQSKIHTASRLAGK